MRKNFITNISFLLLLNLLIKPFWILGIDRGVQNELGPQVYGVYFALFNFAYIFQIVLDFGINNYNNRLIARSPEKLAGQLVSTLLLKIGLGAGYIVVLGIAAKAAGFTSEMELSILGQLALLQIAISFYGFLRSNVNALHLFKTDAVLSILDKAITSLLCGLVLWTNFLHLELSIPLFIWLQLIGYGLSIAAAFLIIGSRRIQFVRHFDWSLIKSIFKQSLPYALLGFLMTAYYRTDGVLLERLLGGAQGDYQAGVYASAFRLLDALNILGFLFAGLLMPMFSRLLESGSSIRSLLQLGFTLMLITSAGAASSFWWYRVHIMDLLYPDMQTEGAAVFGWLMIAFVLMSMTYIFGSLVTAHGNIRALNLISFAGFILNLVLNIIYIPKHLAVGSALATTLTQSLVFIAHAWVVDKTFTERISAAIWIKSLVFICLVSVGGWASSLVPVNWPLQMGISLLWIVPAAFASGMVQLQDLKNSMLALADAISKRTEA